MYLFTRRSQIAGGQISEAVDAALEAGRLVGEATGLPLSVWATVFSDPVGGIAWSTVFDDLESAQERLASAASSAEYLDLVRRGASLWVGPPTDSLYEIVHGGPAEGGPPAIASTVTADLAAGCFVAGMTHGVELCVQHEAITGRPATFLKAVTGSYSGVGWLVGSASMAELEETRRALMASPDWAALIDRGGALFEPGIPSAILRRIS